MNREQAKEQIKSSISCTDYLERSKGDMYCCPICGSGHGKKGTGAVKYYPATNTWHCHACDRGGDVIDAYTATTGSDYSTALYHLAAQAGITINEKTAHETTAKPQSDENQEKDKQTADNKKRPQIEPESLDFSEYYLECFNRISDPAAVSYLTGRGISIETAKRLCIGYDPQADPAGAPGATGNEYKAHPAPRIIVPCTNDFYIARATDPGNPYKSPNPRGTHAKLFNAEALYKADVIFITEGIFDALSFLEAGQAAIAMHSRSNGKLVLKQLQEHTTSAALVIVPDYEIDKDTGRHDPQSQAITDKKAAELKEQLQAMNLQCVIYNIAEEYNTSAEDPGKLAKDANDVFTADRAAFERGIAEAMRKLHSDDITDFLDKILTTAYKPYKTGLNFFDSLLGGGIIQQSLLLLMAAPGTGKTTLAQQIAETMAKERKPVIYFNFEMSREQMLAKAISAKLYRGHGGNKTALQILQGYSWTAEERAKIEDVLAEYQRDIYPYIKYNPAGTSSELKDILTFLKKTGDDAKARGEQAPAAVIDYLHLITSSDGLDTQELIKQAVTGLKQYAVEYNTFVIGIIASNRASNAGGRLTLESGRDSSNLEYTADYQISLNYEAIDSGKVKPADVDKIAKLQEAERRAMILRVLKSRFSQPGKSEKVMFDAAHNIFYGTRDDFIPADGLKMDDGTPAFKEDLQATMRI